MIKTFISQSGQGKSLCMVAEAAVQKNKSVAFLSLEMTEKDIFKRLSFFKPSTKSFLVYAPNSNNNLQSWLFKKIEKVCDEVDIICIDGMEITTKTNLKKINDACFGSFMTQCTELWMSRGVYQKFTFDDNYITKPSAIKSFEVEDLLSVKQVCRKIEHGLLPGVNIIEAIDLEKNEIKNYNLTNLFKN